MSSDTGGKQTSDQFIAPNRVSANKDLKEEAGEFQRKAEVHKTNIHPEVTEDLPEISLVSNISMESNS